MKYVIGMLLIVVLGVSQIVAGFIGIEHELGYVWALVITMLAFGFRFTLPITIGAFFGATDVWGWHWSVALVFVAPGLLFAIPDLFASIVSIVKK